MTPLTDHPRRYELTNELHARPFPTLKAPAEAASLAIRATGDASRRDRARDRAHLLALLDRFGAPHPAPEATHYMGPLGKYHLKWESHTEFVTYTIFAEGLPDRAFAPHIMDLFPADWRAEAPGQVISSILFHIEAGLEHDALCERADAWFERESLVLTDVLAGSMIVAGDFRIDNAGHTRFALFPSASCGPQRIGRILQRLCEIETYKTMSMLGLIDARNVLSSLSEIEGSLSVEMDRLAAGLEEADMQSCLDQILSLSSQIEKLMTQTNFSFGATKAYESIVLNRVELLRETRFRQRQMLGEFMLRRYDPAMRTVDAAMSQLERLSERAARAATLLRTKVDVSRQTQTQILLSSMDRRADLQLRLQETVEGLSVVAISYYAVGLAGYAIAPFLAAFGLSKTLGYAVLTPLVLALVWFALRRLKSQHFKA